MTIFRPPTIPETAEDKERVKIDILLEKAGWKIFDRENADAAGAVIREFPAGGGAADYALYLDGKAAGIIEAKQAGVPLSGAEMQAEKYAAEIIRRPKMVQRTDENRATGRCADFRPRLRGTGEYR